MGLRADLSVSLAAVNTPLKNMIEKKKQNFEPSNGATRIFVYYPTINKNHSRAKKNYYVTKKPREF